MVTLLPKFVFEMGMLRQQIVHPTILEREHHSDPRLRLLYMLSTRIRQLCSRYGKGFLRELILS